MTGLLTWLDANKGWIFDGVGVAALVGLWQLLARWRRSRRQASADPTPVGPAIPWRGVEVRGRFFVWDGPILHSLPDRQAIPAPDIAIKAIRDSGATPSFGRQDKLRHHIATGSMQVYETDRQTWKRELLYAGDGSQILLVKDAST